MECSGRAIQDVRKVVAIVIGGRRSALGRVYARTRGIKTPGSDPSITGGPNRLKENQPDSPHGRSESERDWRASELAWSAQVRNVSVVELKS